MKIVAFLPCRSGSVRVPEKNTRPFAASGESLLDIKMRQLCACEAIDEVVVSTNDPVVKERAHQFSLSANKAFRVDERPDYLGQSSTTTDELIRYVPTVIPDGHILWTHVTSPFAGSEFYLHAVAEYERALNSGFDSVMSATKIQTFLFDDKGPVNFDNSKEKWPRTQTLPVWWEINSALFLVERDLCLRLGDRVGDRPLILEMDHSSSFDIDTLSQFHFGSQLWNTRNAAEVSR